MLDALTARRRTEANGFRWRGGDVSRLEAFSDAVFAFALALLVVSLDVPKSVPELLAILRGFPAFGATFATLVWIWHCHYIYFRRFGFVDAVATTLNAGLLFVILFFVYPLKFMFGAIFDGMFTGHWAFTFQEGRVLLLVYSLGFIAVFGMFRLLYGHALSRRSELELNPLEELFTRANMRAYSLLVLIGVVTGLAGWFGPPWLAPFSGMFYGAIGPVMWWHWARVDRARQALLPSPAAT